MRRSVVLPGSLLLLISCSAAPQDEAREALPPAPAAMLKKLSIDLQSTRPYQHHVWRDTEALNADGTVSGYIEIPRGESTKWEFRISRNRREVDRTLPAHLGGYPINYGFMPGTISYDGDPADILVLGPPIPGGSVVAGRIAGLMEMIDTGELDSKVVISPLDAGGEPTEALSADDRQRLEQFFNTYKNHEGKETRITGWGDEAKALLYLQTTAGFFDRAEP